MKIIKLDGTEQGSIELPQQFNEEIRADLVAKAVEVIQCNKKQPYGAKADAGLRASAELSRRRNNYRGSYGHGISRVPRKIMSRNGTRMNWVGAVAPGTVGGRRAHPPKSAKILKKSINEKERKKAIRSALAASVDKEIVASKGHIIPENYPFVITNDIEKLEKTKEIKTFLEKAGFKNEIKRSAVKKIRAGIGKLRGRKYKTKKGPLLVVGAECKLTKSAQNLPGIEIVQIKNINCELLAPGKQLARATLFTENAIKELKEKNLFI
jgi:large subunit ribosomal protein L4e